MIGSRAFVRHPHEIALINLDLQAWIADLEDGLRCGTYVPEALFTCNVPKPFGGIRPGAFLNCRDLTVYAACVGVCLGRIRNELSWAKNIDYSVPIVESDNETAWLRNPFKGWRDFRTQSLVLLEKATHVVVADVAGFYEYIDIEILISELRRLAVEPGPLRLLSQCLNKWAKVQKGIPQGYSPSDVLAKLYLGVVDRGLKEKGLTHIRYMDDFRIFCDSEAEARRALVELTTMLRVRGLVLQTAKSRIQTRAEASISFDGVQATVQEVRQDLVREAAEASGGDPYFSLWEVEMALASGTDRAPLEVVHRAYDDHFVAGSEDFNKTLLHFLLRRMAKAGSDHAIPHVLSYLVSMPQETGDILRYLGDIGKTKECEERLLSLLTNDLAIYPYQHYQFIQWWLSEGVCPNEKFIRWVRGEFFERSIPPYLASVCAEFLGRFGSPADIERIEARLEDPISDLKRAELICAVRRLESGRRNSILGRFAGQGFLTSRAVELVRQEKDPASVK